MPRRGGRMECHVEEDGQSVTYRRMDGVPRRGGWKECHVEEDGQSIT